MSVLIPCDACGSNAEQRPIRHIASGSQVKVNETGILFDLVLACGHPIQHLSDREDEADAITSCLIAIDVAKLEAEEEAKRHQESING